jgi:gas vesicle structural protein
MSDTDELESRTLVLSDLVNRVLDKGVVISGHVTISIADIDLLELDLKLLLTSIETATRRNMSFTGSPADAHTPVLPPRRGK